MKCRWPYLIFFCLQHKNLLIWIQTTVNKSAVLLRLPFCFSELLFQRTRANPSQALIVYVGISSLFIFKLCIWFIHVPRWCLSKNPKILCKPLFHYIASCIFRNTIKLWIADYNTREVTLICVQFCQVTTFHTRRPGHVWERLHVWWMSNSINIINK